jgi:hypothetical protein
MLCVRFTVLHVNPDACPETAVTESAHRWSPVGLSMLGVVHGK